MICQILLGVSVSSYRMKSSMH